MWICCKLSLQPVHISLKVKDTNLVMEVRYNLLGISPNRCGKWWETHHQFHYIHQSLILLSITLFCNGVLGALNWNIISCSLRRESNLLDTNSPLRCNWTSLICLHNRLSDSSLNSMNLSKALNFLCTRYTYPNLEHLSIKVMKYPYPVCVWTPNVLYTSVFISSKHSLVLCILAIKGFLVILPLMQDL